MTDWVDCDECGETVDGDSQAVHTMCKSCDDAADEVADALRAVLEAVRLAAGAYPDSDLPALVAALKRAADAYDELHDARTVGVETTYTVHGRDFTAANACPCCRGLMPCGCGYGLKAKEGDGHV
jgi:hypothetical protein